MKRFLSWIVAFASASIVFGGATQPAPMDLTPMLASVVAQYKLPGMVGAIIHGDRLVAIGSTGVRKMGYPAPFLADDTIHLGSCTKAMTALLIGQLIDQKQLTFDATMRDVFPDIAAKMNPAMAAVTVRNLLDHDAGLPHDLPWGMLAATHLPLPAQRKAAVELALSAPPAGPVGSYSYSNVGFVVLGAIIERKTGLSWEEVIRRDIFHPLGMTSAGFGAPGKPGLVDQPWGHVLEGGKLKAVQVDNPPIMGPAGTAHCTIGDWSKFVIEILRGAQGHPTLLSAATFKQLITPMPKENYAGGWLITSRPWAGGLALTHTGSNTTWFCDVWLAPKLNFAVLVATNDGAEPAGEAADNATGLLVGVDERLAP